VQALYAAALAAHASSMYALSTSLQALEARRAPASVALRSALVAQLVRRPLWLAGAAAGVLAWPLQAGALAIGSVALVQPALGLGLVVLLVLGVRLLHERVGPREVSGAVAIAAAVAVLAWVAPKETGAFTPAGTWCVGLALPLVVAVPQALRLTGRVGGLATSVFAGLGWAWVGLGTALVDGALADRRWLAAVAWGLGVAAASWTTLVTEMTALQQWPATRAIPIAFGLEMVVPAALAPLLASGDPRNTPAFVAALAVAAGGALLLGSSRAVARGLGSPHGE
jgi:hypothetical protein